MPARVVVVRDDAVRDRIVEALQDAGISVRGFDGPMPAFDAIKAGEQTELLITGFDFGPDRQNGVSLALMCKMQRPRLKVLFAGREEFRHFTDRMGEFVAVETLDLPSLVSTVRRLLGD